MNTYYEIKAINIDGDDEVLFGSFDKSDCTYEMQAEKDSWKADGYKQIAITSRNTDEQPDPEVYAIEATEDNLIIDEPSQYQSEYHVMFSSPQPFGVNGCPMGRGATLTEAAADLKRRTEIESPVNVEIKL